MFIGPRINSSGPSMPESFIKIPHSGLGNRLAAIAVGACNH
jgi:hypothetical protein